jgi:hypothetical protein
MRLPLSQRMRDPRTAVVAQRSVTHGRQDCARSAENVNVATFRHMLLPLYCLFGRHLTRRFVGEKASMGMAGMPHGRRSPTPRARLSSRADDLLDAAHAAVELGADALHGQTLLAQP